MNLQATPHRDCASDTPADFSLDCEMTTKQYFVYCKEEFCKIKKNMLADGVQSRRRSLCGVACIYYSTENRNMQLLFSTAIPHCTQKRKKFCKLLCYNRTDIKRRRKTRS
ncbi:MAG: hypothetical protein LUC50_00310, partial [Ruminococcus sp.]|nr:hypothetical protein [Ruminococcus sp.]